MGKLHGGLAKVGKVKNQTPRVEPADKAKKKVGRAQKRELYNRRFINPVTDGQKVLSPNSQKAQRMVKQPVTAAV